MDIGTPTRLSMPLIISICVYTPGASRSSRSLSFPLPLPLFSLFFPTAKCSTMKIGKIDQPSLFSINIMNRKWSICKRYRLIYSFFEKLVHIGMVRIWKLINLWNWWNCIRYWLYVQFFLTNAVERGWQFEEVNEWICCKGIIASDEHRRAKVS